MNTPDKVSVSLHLGGILVETFRKEVDEKSGEVEEIKDSLRVTSPKSRIADRWGGSFSNADGSVNYIVITSNPLAALPPSPRMMFDQGIYKLINHYRQGYTKEQFNMIPVLICFDNQWCLLDTKEAGNFSVIPLKPKSFDLVDE